MCTELDDTVYASSTVQDCTKCADCGVSRAAHGTFLPGAFFLHSWINLLGRPGEKCITGRMHSWDTSLSNNIPNKMYCFYIYILLLQLFVCFFLFVFLTFK